MHSVSKNAVCKECASSKEVQLGMLGVQARVTKQLKEARDQWRVAKEESQTLQRQLAALTAQVCLSFSLYLFRL